MASSDTPNPYAVTTLEIGEPIRERAADISRTARWLVIIGMPLMLIGMGLAFVDVETIMGSGPVMFVWGVLLLFLTRKRDQSFRWFAIACCVFPLVVFLIIFMMSWSPGQAQDPISILIACFVAVTIIGCFVTFRHLKKLSASLPPEPDRSEPVQGTLNPPAWG